MKKHSPPPPRWTQWLLRALHPDQTLEEVEGDLAELYADWYQRAGPTLAAWYYVRSVVSVLPPWVRRRRAQQTYRQPSLFHPAMISNYLKIARRNLLRNKGYSFINIAGLAIGMAVAMLIGFWVWDEWSYNKEFQHYDRIAQVMQHETYNGQIGTQTVLPFPLGAELRRNYNTDFKYVVMSSWILNHSLAVGETIIIKSGTFMEPQAADMLSLTMRKGTRTGLTEPASILLSESAASALFGTRDPLGKLLKLDSRTPVKVTGIYQDIPHNSSFSGLSFIAPWSLYLRLDPGLKAMENVWDDNSFQTFVQLADHADPAVVSAKIKHVIANRVPKEDANYKPEVFLNPMSQWRLFSEFRNGVRIGGRIQSVWLFGLIGAFVLLLGCINFMNLSTARSEKRAKEVGIRKAIGSLRTQLITQFYAESLLVVLLAFGLALLLVVVLLPGFNQVANKQLQIQWENPVFWLLGLGVSLLTGLIAGSYPALYLSTFNPITVLKGTFRVGKWATLPRQVLVVTQFTVSITLIIGTILIFRQIQYAKGRPVGYNRAGLVMINIQDYPTIQTQFDPFREELRKAGLVTEAAQSLGPTTEVWSTNGDISWPGKDPHVAADFPHTGVSHDYGKTVGWHFIQGRDFSRSFTTDSSAFILNEAAVHYMGLKQPVGQIVRWGARSFRVIGVIKDMVVGSPYAPVRPSLYSLAKQHDSYAILRINPSLSAHDALAKVEGVFKHYNPAVPFTYGFADQEYAKKFGDEEQTGRLASFFASLAVFISCLGLFGLASYVAETRTKEVGVRKVLGASVLNLWGLLSKDFLVLVVIAFLLATPLAYYFGHRWLASYTYRVEITWWVFIATGAGALVLTLVTVSYQSLKAALINPVKSLRSE